MQAPHISNKHSTQLKVSESGEVSSSLIFSFLLFCYLLLSGHFESHTCLASLTTTKEDGYLQQQHGTARLRRLAAGRPRVPRRAQRDRPCRRGQGQFRSCLCPCSSGERRRHFLDWEVANDEFVVFFDTSNNSFVWLFNCMIQRSLFLSWQ